MSRHKNDSERLLDEFSRWIVTIPSAETVDTHTVSYFVLPICFSFNFEKENCAICNDSLITLTLNLIICRNMLLKLNNR